MPSCKDSYHLQASDRDPQPTPEVPQWCGRGTVEGDQEPGHNLPLSSKVSDREARSLNCKRRERHMSAQTDGHEEEEDPSCQTWG